MKLPRRDHAFIPERKLTSYLLSLSHPVGRGKARFFRRLGFDLSNTDILRDGLLTLARQSNVVRAEQTDYGTKYMVDGLLSTPRGDEVPVRTVWIIEESDRDVPRFVTAYPA
ncbi:MAG: hypothetical protein R6U20_03955 [Longimonas sp.]|uniref:DUF6883 domain-containing protein n=1 Tax=Longimonas sp. TaxID=2039626 RepID=UPI0039757CB9